MPYKVIEYLKKHIKEHILIYILVMMCFLIGISVGAFSVKIIGYQQKQELVSYLRGFFQVFSSSEPIGAEILRESLKNNLQLLLLNCFLGVIVVGVPGVLAIVGFKGFVLGFTVGLLIEEFKLYGGLIFLLSILPQNIIFIPVFVFAAVVAITYSIHIIRAKAGKQRNFSLSKQMLSFSSLHLGLGLLVLVGALVESFVVPFFLRIIVRLL